MNLVKIGDDRIEKFGDTRAYIFENEEFTSSRLNEMGRRLASGLKSLGIGRGDHIKNIIVLGGEDQGDQVDFNGLIEKHPPLQLTEEMNEDDVALMIYTSGTTGRPKGVMLSHNNLHQNALSTYEAGEAIKGDVALLCLPLAHSFGVVIMNAGFHSPFSEGFGVLMRWFDPEEVLRLIEKYRVTLFIGVPVMYQLLLSNPAAEKYDTSSLERCTISAAPVTEELYRSFTTKFI